MLELLLESFKIYNLPFTILITMVLLYWIVALCGFIDLDIGGGDIDVDLELELDPDLEIDGGGGGGGMMSGALRWAGFADAPLVLLLSLLALFLWATNLLANHHFNPESSLSRAGLLLIPVLLISFIITRLLIKPLAPLMRFIKGEEPAAKIIGEEAKVISAKIDNEFGRIEIDFDGKPILLNAVLSEEDSEPLAKGEKVLVVSRQEDSKKNYIVRSLKN